MAALDWHTTGSDGVTLVELVVTSTTTERVRIENCLDGPVWPPRRQGVPAEGWTEDGFEGRVTPDERLVLGYASPAAPRDPPARIAKADPATDERREVTPREVVRSLGDPAPPREAVPTPAPGDCETVPADDWSSSVDGPNPAPEAEMPPPVAAYLQNVADRLDDAERLAGPSTVDEASDALAAVGGPGEAATLPAQLATDRDTLELLATRCETLAARIDAVDLPVETLAGLA